MQETLDEKPEETMNTGEAQPDLPVSGIKGFFKKNGPAIGLVVLILYVILLAIGVFAEVFKIQSILDWWIFRAPSR
ncbi:MAG: hypothetical protein HZA17_12430 [Nitrospirae bacterium]|nr:hypothetical protein [Nitrospirota bacterium]